MTGSWFRRWKSASLPTRLLSLFILLGLTQWLQLLWHSEFQTAVVLLGIVVSWVAYATLLTLGGWLLVRRLRKRQPRPSDLATVPSLAILLGCGLLFSASGLALWTDASAESLLELASAGAILIAWGFIQQRQPWTSRKARWTLLAASVLFFTLLREGGNLSLEWSRSSASSSSNDTGSWNCSGLDLDGRSSTLADYRPAYAINPVSDGSTFSDIIAGKLRRRFGYSEANSDRDLAHADVRVQSPEAGPLCYLPLWHSDSRSTRVDIALHYGTGGKARIGEPDGWRLTCTGSIVLNHRSKRSTWGIASCRNLLDDDAEALSRKIASALESRLGY